MSIALKQKNDPMMGDSSRLLGMQIYDQMESGEIYAPDPMTGMGGEFISPGPDPKDPRNIPLQEYGYFDAMAAQPGASGGPQVQRLDNIQQITGAQLDVRNPYYQEDPMIDQAKVDVYNKLSLADRVALRYVDKGLLDPKDLYKTMKDGDVRRETAHLEFLAKIDPGKNRVQLSRNGQNVPISGSSVNDLMNPAGNTSVDVGAPYPSVSSQTINQPGREGGTSIKEDKNLSNIDKNIRNDYIVKQRTGQLQYAQNTLDLLQSDNPVANMASRTQLARLSGEVGVLTDADIARFGGSQAFSEQLNQATTQVMTGKLSKKNKGFLIHLAATFKDAAKESLNNRLVQMAEGQSAAFNVPIDRIAPLINAYGVNLNYGAAPAAGTKASYATPQEAEAAFSRGEIKVGDEITVGGRPAKWE